ncbi:MAG: DNA adenine methylase, partial [Eubacteriales bacterium]
MAADAAAVATNQRIQFVCLLSLSERSHGEIVSIYIFVCKSLKRKGGEHEKNKLVAPVLKWVGGKRQLLETFQPLLPNRITTYCEPFFGGGALLFHLQPHTAYINDINPELIRVYRVIKDNVEALITELARFENTEEY